jgi:Raf kinase inhibitor-like YbhB/YbcL family protein
MLRLLTVHASQSVDDSLPASDAKGAPSMTFSLTSPAFPDGGEIPNRYTCEGRDVSPPLTWSEPPSGTKSLALIVDDPDAPDPKAPKMTWVHWVLYNLPPTVGQLAEAVERKALPTGTREGLNDWKRTGYGGPCPPNRAPPLLPQGLRPRHCPSRPRPANQGAARKGNARARARRRRTRRNV